MARMSALHLFRRDYIAGQPKGKDWFSAAGWAEVKQAFQALSLERRELYESQRQHLVERERHLQRAHPQSRDCGILLLSSKPTVSGMSTSQLCKPEGMDDMDLCALPCCRGTGHSAPLLANLLPGELQEVDKAAKSAQAFLVATEKHAAQQTDQTAWPLDESNVLSTLATTRAKGHSLKEATRDFCRKSQVIAGPKPDQPLFPSTVVIHGKCSGLCQLEHSVQERVAFNKVVQALTDLSSWDKPTKVVQADVLLACSVLGGDGRPPTVLYCFLTAVSSKGGYNPADAVYLLCDVCSGSPDGTDGCYESRLSLGFDK